MQSRLLLFNYISLFIVAFAVVAASVDVARVAVAAAAAAVVWVSLAATVSTLPSLVTVRL